MDEKHRDVGGKLEIGGKTYAIYGGLNTIGRNKEAIVNIKNLGISQHHAVFILIDDDLHFISDLKSSNGTFLNGKKLLPLQLYQLESGSHVQFANIGGIYTKCDCEHSDNISASNLENTQDSTQSFYGVDTQVTDVTESRSNQNKTQLVPTQKVHYIPTQVLLRVASDLETTYEKLHEQTTQLLVTNVGKDEYLEVNSRNLLKNEEKSSCDMDQSDIVDLHEAETQKVINYEGLNIKTNGEYQIHEAETQKIPQDDQLNLSNCTVEKLFVEDSNSPDKVLLNKELNNQCHEVSISNPLLVSTTSIELDVATQDSDGLNPLVLSRNVLRDSQNSIESQSSPLHDTGKINEETSSIVPASEEKNISSANIVRTEEEEINPFSLHKEDSMSSKYDIRPSGKSVGPFSLNEDASPHVEDSDKERDESSNDSVDFMTMQKISDIERKQLELYDKEKNPNEEENEILQYSNKKKHDNAINKITVLQDNDSETDIEVPNVGRSSSNAETDVSDTDIEKCNSKVAQVLVSKKEKKDKLESDSDSELDEIRVKKKSKFKKKRPIVQKMFDSDSETDVENRFPKKIDSDSDAEADVGKIKFMKSKSSLEIEKAALSDGSFIQNRVTEIDETKLGDTSVQIRNDDTLNESDIILATQDCFSAPKNPSQNSKFDNSEESFKLGLTQLMEEESKKQSQSDTKTNLQKKGSLENINDQVHDASDFPVEDIYQAKTQNVIGETKSQCDNDDFLFIQPTQCIVNEKDESVTCGLTITKGDPEDIYLQPTQECTAIGDPIRDLSPIFKQQTEKQGEVGDSRTSGKIEDDIYLQPTQQCEILDYAKSKVLPQKDHSEINEKGISVRSVDRLEEAINDIYLKATRECEKALKESNEVSADKELEGIHDKNVQTTEDCQKSLSDIPKEASETGSNNEEFNYEREESTSEIINDDDDLFATQTSTVKPIPNRGLESELENMFATQKARPSYESLDKIQSIVLQKQVIDCKLPEEDSDLEAILATQRILDSPKRSKPLGKNVEAENVVGHSIESQLEVLFASPKLELPADKFVRPANPLCTVLREESQEQNISVPREVADVKTNGLEQSFALLDAKSTKIRRSARSKTCEEITVKCNKSRISMGIASNKKSEEEVNLVPEKEKVSRKRNPSISTLEVMNTITDKESGEKRRKTNVLGDEEVKTKRKTREQKVEAVVSEESGGGLPRKSNRKLEVRATDVETDRKLSRSKKSEEDRSKVETTSKISQSTRGSRLIDRLDRIPEIQSEKVEEKISKFVTLRGKKKISNDDKNNVDFEDKTRRKISKVANKNEMQKDSSSSVSSGNSEPDTPRAKRKSAIKVTTPSKIKKCTEDAVPSPSRTETNPETPSKSRRKQKHKVVFTMLDNPQLEASIKGLGGTVVDTVEDCTVLITGSVKRTLKLLSAVGLARPICSTKWVEISKNENEFSDPWDYLLVDEAAEKNWDFSLKTSLLRSSQSKLFEGYTFQLLVSTALDVLKGAIESCGGKIVTRTPKEVNKFVVVACPGQKEKYKKLLKQKPNLTIVEPEAIFDGVLRQEIRFERHLLK